MRSLPAFLFLFLSFFCVPLFSADWTNSFLTEKMSIRDYRVVCYRSSGKRERLITREIVTDKGKRYYYFIDTGTLRYGLTDALDRTNSAQGLEQTTLGKVFLLQQKRARPYGSSYESFSKESNKNIVLTTDLCPTPNDFDRQFYSNLQSISTNYAVKIPVVVFISGGWVKNHSNQLTYIKKSGLDVIAGNHTYHHDILTNRESLKRFTGELTNTEVILLENGVLPSYLFRYPGLVYHKEYMKELGTLSLVSVNANVWMGTKAKNWGILLVHSNGCASSEVRIFSKFLKNNLKDILKKKLDFRDIYSYFNESCSKAN